MKNKPVLKKIHIEKTENPIKNQRTNHVLVIDCSGSMSSELPKIRKQLKVKIPALVKENDTVSLVWFSGKDQSGVLAEKFVVNSLMDLNYLEKTIDRFLKPIGMTGFVDPLQNVIELASSCDDEPVSLMFLTDGYDNAWPVDQILSVSGNVGGMVASAVIVEYGWNCNRPLLSQMAEKIGASVIFCEEFDKYDPIIDSLFSKTLSGVRKLEIEVGKPLFNMVFSTSKEGPISYEVNDGIVEVPESVDDVFFYVDGKGDDIFDNETVAVLQSVVLLSRKMESGFIKRVLAQLGYVELFEKFCTSFGKQNLTDFQSYCLELSKDASKLKNLTVSDDLKVNPNAFTVLDLLFTLTADKKNLIVVDEMNYKRIGRAREDASDKVSKDELADLQEAMKNVTDKAGLDELMAKIATIQSDKTPKLTFVADKVAGYPISNLVWNESRPNVSIQIRKTGTVELPAEEAKKFGLPQKFPTFIYRNYTIIADGIVNFDFLPVRLTDKTTELLGKKVKKATVIHDDVTPYTTLYIRGLPTINEKMINKVSAKDFLVLKYVQAGLKAQQKVIKFFREKWFGKKTSEGWVTKYTADAIEWLGKLGLTDYSGFSPKVTVCEKSGDFYMSVELVASIPSLSKVPSVNEFLKAVESAKKSGKKLNIANSLFVAPFEKATAIEAMPIDTRDGYLTVWDDEVDARMAVLERECVETMFSIVVGQSWFKEFKSLSENEIEVTLNGEPVQCSVQLKDKQVDL